MRRVLGLALCISGVLLGIVMHAQAVSDPVNVMGRSLPKIALSVDTTTVDFGSIDPMTSAELAPAFTAAVKSNEPYAYALSAPASFTGGVNPDINHMEWDRWGAAPPGYVPFWEGDVDTVLFAPKTAGRDFRYSLRLTWDYDEDPNVAYSTELTVTALQW